jgi:hypothetical protein
MNKLSLTLLTCLILLSQNIVMGETWDDLVERDGFYYNKFSKIPFSKKVTGKRLIVYFDESGPFTNGKKAE